MGNGAGPFRLGASVLVVFSLFGVSCREAGPGEATPLARLAVSQAPLSENPFVVLVSEITACVIESYEYRVHCIDRNDDVLVGIFGRQGDGPGEFRSPLYLIRGPKETAGVIDIGLGRMTIFEPTGRLVENVRLPGSIFTPGAHFSSTLIGSDFLRGVSRHIEIDVASGEIVWERVYPTALREESGCQLSTIKGLMEGVASPGGSLAFAGCQGHLIFFEDRDDESGTLVPAPTYTAELPNRRDTREYAEFRSSFGPGVEEYRRTPKQYSAHRWFDERGRLWVLTNRDRDEFSYLDIYQGPEYVGTVRVRDRAVGFDVLGSTLAVLVDRSVGPDDPDGFPDRAIDWYDISRIDFGERGLHQAQP